ncbi:hypothetical protein F511_08466 [Dorcoceras hygrometricum]|uniref:RCC1-like domain-containing protein n=1 Tax=Dorcoceras hygrometricum TaxID=472368 RepID=A0A2Z7ABD2_9LAMI|nr:hypothetical protein F511_08466 [Dorcoceras hygrometricum]
MAEEGQMHSGNEDISGPFRGVLLISAGASHSLAVLAGNAVCSWGRGEDGQLGHGDADDRFSPTLLSGLDGKGIVSVSCGSDHTAAYSDSEAQVYSWGWGDFGRLGHGHSSDLFSPQPIKAIRGLQIKQIACGDSHCLAVTMEGELHSWGRNQNGQLGLGNTEDSLVPRKVEAFQGKAIKMFAAGAEHTVAVTEDGELYGWGWGRYGNLGLGDRGDRLVPGIVSAVVISGGWRHTMAVTSDGKLYGWSWNKFGQLGVGDNVDHCSPVQVTFPLEQAYIDFLLNSFNIHWFNFHLAIFLNSFKSEALDPILFFFKTSPILLDHCRKSRKSRVLQGEKMVLVACGWRHTISVSSSGSLYTCGWSKYGQLGHGDFKDHLIPHKLDSLGGNCISRISGGWRHTMAVTSDGKLYGWGWNKKVEKISCGWRHTLAVTERQNVFSWGRGTNGQLGHGDSVDLNVPKIIVALSRDGSSGQCLEISKADCPKLSRQKNVSPTDRYAVVPDENHLQIDHTVSNRNHNRDTIDGVMGLRVSKLSRLTSFPNLRQRRLGSSSMTPRGYIPVAVGVNDETRRFMVHTRALCDSKFLALLDKSEEEYGFRNEGIIRIPYDARAFEKWMNKGAKYKTFFRVQPT